MPPAPTTVRHCGTGTGTLLHARLLLLVLRAQRQRAALLPRALQGALQRVGHAAALAGTLRLLVGGAGLARGGTRETRGTV